ncbi:MAG: hypothetical protein QGF67_05565 [Lentisphaeria bacterium]|jgi:hypothetical protein|nr:hypothetical protein [Lentisphaeria bacterium]
MQLKIILLIVAGGVLLFMGLREFRMMQAAAPEPQTISCAELEKNGPGANSHVIMEDFILLEQAFVYEAAPGSNIWTKLYIPAVPIGGAYHLQILSMRDENGRLPENTPMPGDIGIIVKSEHISGKDELTTLAAADALQGLVINKIKSLGSEEKRLLEESYPGVDFEACWIIEDKRRPPGMGKVAALGGGGIALLFAGLGALFLGRKNG